MSKEYEMPKYVRHSVVELEPVLEAIGEAMKGKPAFKKVKVRKEFNGKMVGVSSLRLQTFFLKGTVCACCGAKATHFAIEQNSHKFAQDEPIDYSIGNYHLNMWGIDANGKPVLFTHDAIEAKVRATQEAEKAQRDLARIKFEAEQKIVTAKAQAETIRIQSEAIRAQGGKEFVALEGIKKWDGVMPKFIGGNAPVPFISVDNK